MRFYISFFVITLIGCGNETDEGSLLPPAELCKKMSKLNPDRLPERKIDICTKKMEEMKAKGSSEFTAVQSCISKAKTKEDTEKCSG